MLVLNWTCLYEGCFYMSISLFRHQQMHVKTMRIINWLHLPSEVDCRKVENCPLCLRIHISDHFWSWWMFVWRKRKRTIQSSKARRLWWYGVTLVLMGGVTCASAMMFITLKNKHPAIVLYNIQLMCCYMVLGWLFKLLALAKQQFSIFTIHLQVGSC